MLNYGLWDQNAALFVIVENKKTKVVPIRGGPYAHEQRNHNSTWNPIRRGVKDWKPQRLTVPSAVAKIITPSSIEAPCDGSVSGVSISGNPTTN